MDFKRKRIILIAGILFLTGITSAVIKFIPSKSIHLEKKALPQEKVKKPALQITTPTPANNADTAKITATTTMKASGANQKWSAMLHDEEDLAGKEREEEYRDDTPEQAQKRASLEKEIRTLSQAKEKEEKELSSLISSLDEAYKNSQLPPDELQKKQAEVKMIKMLLMRTYSEILSAIDSSLQEKLQQYREVTTEKIESPETVDLD